jgi:hypothetical protein
LKIKNLSNFEIQKLTLESDEKQIVAVAEVTIPFQTVQFEQEQGNL